MYNDKYIALIREEMAMGIEFELKYEANAQTQDTLRCALDAAAEGKDISMETTYYDTPGGDLSARHYTLRRRLENGVSVCTVKTPAGKLGRGEWETEGDTIEAAIEPLCLLGAPKNLLLLTLNGVEAICGARFLRRCYMLETEGCTVEVAIDRGVLTGGGQELPLFEVEVELKKGSRDAAIRFAAALAEKYGLKQQRQSKFRRAWALYKGE